MTYKYNSSIEYNFARERKYLGEISWNISSHRVWHENEILTETFFIPLYPDVTKK